jgi:hypothetical protein
MTSASLPLTRTIPMPPSPGGVDTAHMVSCSRMAVYYHKQPGIKNEFRRKAFIVEKNIQSADFAD